MIGFGVRAGAISANHELNSKPGKPDSDTVGNSDSDRNSNSNRDSNADGNAHADTNSNSDVDSRATASQ